ncbi:MAG: MFS transporter [Chromatiaceae bacterium]|nr:MFS transporter [Ectothiorhodospira sp. BSL-9]TVQ74440.1 MAG: MFS transporter [Chromatiaceae bacterium]
MFPTLKSVSTLLLGMGILLCGSGMLGTLLGLSAAQEGLPSWLIGLIMSGFFMGFIIGSFLCPGLIRRVGHIRAFGALAAVSAIAALLHGLIFDPWIWWVLRIFNGISVVGLYMVIESWLNERARHNRGQIFAFYMMICLVMLGVGQFLVLIYGPGQLASYALVAILFSLGLIPIALTPALQPAPIKAQALSLRVLYDRTPVGVIGALVSGIASGGFWGFGAIYAQQSGIAPLGVATFVSAVILGGALLQWPIGFFSDHRDRRWVLVFTCAGAAVAALAIFLTVDDQLTMLLVAALFYGGFAFSLYALAVAHTHDRLDVTEVLEGTRGLLLINGIGATMGPLMAGIAVSVASISVLPLLFGAIILLLSLFALWRILREPPVAREEKADFLPVTRTSVVAAELDPRTELQPELDLENKP